MRAVTENTDRGFSAAVMVPALLGCIFGAIVLVLAGAETRWIIYFSAGTFYLVAAVIVSDSAKLFWITLLLGLQFNVYLRFFYGYAGGEGLAVSLPGILAGVLTIFLLVHQPTMHHERVDVPSIRWGGPMGYPIAILFAISIGSLIASNEQFVGVTELFIHFQYYLVYLVALNYVVTKKRFLLSVRLLLAMLVIQSLIYYLQSGLGLTFTLIGTVIEAGELPRPGGTVSTRPAGFASFIIPIICISTALFVSKKSEIGRFWKTGLPTILGLLAIVLTFTRAAWGSIILGLALVAFLSFRRNNLSTRKFTMIIATGIVAAMASAPGIMARLDSAPLKESYDERAALMGMAINVIKQNPILGVGPGAYKHTYKRYLTQEQRNLWTFTVHNMYLIRAAELGIFGGVAWILFLIAGLRLAWNVSRSHDPTVRAVAIGCAGGVVGLSFEMFWDVWIGFPYNALIWLLFGLLGAANGFSASQEDPVPSNLVNVR